MSAASLERVLAIVFGPPGRNTTSVLNALHAIARLVVPDCTTEEINSQADLERRCLDGSHFLAFSQFPPPELIRYIVQNGCPMIVVLDDPLNSVSYLTEQGLHSETSIVRAASAGYACIDSLLTEIRLPGAGIEYSNAGHLLSFLVRLAEMNGVDTSGATLTHLEMRAVELANRFALAGGLQTDLSPAMGAPSALARGALSHFVDFHHSTSRTPVAWTASSFLLADFPDTPVAVPVDLAGPARCLIYGPYLHLSRGCWTASIRLALSEDADAQSFTIEIICGETVARGRFQLPGPGLCEVEMKFSHRDPHLPIELRLFLDAGAIYGALNEFNVSLKKCTGRKCRTGCEFSGAPAETFPERHLLDAHDLP